jgi:hypothetical protein
MREGQDAESGIQRGIHKRGGNLCESNDGVNLKPFLERMREMLGKAYQKITADAEYESEEN